MAMTLPRRQPDTLLARLTGFCGLTEGQALGLVVTWSLNLDPKPRHVLAAAPESETKGTPIQTLAKAMQVSPEEAVLRVGPRPKEDIKVRIRQDDWDQAKDVIGGSVEKVRAILRAMVWTALCTGVPGRRILLHYMDGDWQGAIRYHDFLNEDEDLLGEDDTVLTTYDQPVIEEWRCRGFNVTTSRWVDSKYSGFAITTHALDPEVFQVVPEVIKSQPPIDPPPGRMVMPAPIAALAKPYAGIFAGVETAVVDRAKPVLGEDDVVITGADE